MIDAPDGAPAPADTPTAPIEQQVQTPNPVEGDIPLKEPEQPEVKPERPSVAESLKRAEAKVRDDADKGDKAKTEPKPDAKPAKEPEKAEKAETKSSEGPNRDEKGKFAPKDPDTKPQEAAGEQKTAPAAEQPAKPTTAHSEAPKRFDDGAKAEWEKVPESVRGATHRIIRELESGLEQYKADYEPLKEYQQLAKQHGTTIKDGLDRYVGLERQLMSQNINDKLNAIRHVFDYAGMNVREFAARVMGQTPEQATMERDNEVQSLRHQVARLEQKLSGVDQSIKDQGEKAAEAQAEAFVQEHPRIDTDKEFSATFARLIETGMADDLQGAYEMAERLHPAPNTAAAQTRSNVSTQSAADDQTVKGSKSVSGAPGTGTMPAKKKPSSSIMEALKRAEAQVG